MTVRVKITTQYGKKPPVTTEGDFSSLIAAAKFTADYMSITPARNRGLRLVSVEIVEKQPKA